MAGSSSSEPQSAPRKEKNVKGQGRGRVPSELVDDDSGSKTGGHAPVGPRPVFIPGRGYWIVPEGGVPQQVWPVPMALTHGICTTMQGRCVL